MTFLNDHAKSVSSQFGENGIISKIFDEIGAENKSCVDIGAQYIKRRSNLYPLLAHHNWQGYLIEGDAYLCNMMRHELSESEHLDEQSVEIHNIRVESTGPNELDQVLDRLKLPTNFDLLNIDVDGIDYHLWKELRNYRPRVAIIEYNMSIPPEEIMIGKSEYNTVGVSLRPLVDLANEKQYDLVALTPANAIFVREEESNPFEAKNNIQKMWEADYHGQHLMYVYRTFEEELFFPRGPVIREEFDFADPANACIEQEDEFYFASPHPKPYEFCSYFFKYPVIYFFRKSRFVDRMKTFANQLGLSWLINPIVGAFQEYD